MPGEVVERPRKPARRRAGRNLALDFYMKAVDAAEAIELEEASEVEGLDGEIAMLRVRLRKVLSEHKEDLPLMLKGIELLVKAVSARYRLSPKAAKDLADNLAGVVNGVGGQLFPEEFRE